MTNRKNSATGNAGDGTANSQEQMHALYTAHQVHTLANLIYRQITTGQSGFGGNAQGVSASGAAAAQGVHGHSPSHWMPGAAPAMHAQDSMAPDFTGNGAMNNPFGSVPFGAIQGAAMNQGFGFNPYFGAQSFGFNPYGGQSGWNNGFAPGFGGQSFANGHDAFGFSPYFAGNGFGAAQNPYGASPFGMYGGAMGNPYGFMPHWMFGNAAGMNNPFGFTPNWGVHPHAGSNDPSFCASSASAPRGAGFPVAPALFYWYP